MCLIKEEITLIAAVLTFFVGLANNGVIIYHNWKKTFIDVITQERLEYVKNLRNHISRFCSIASRNTLDISEELLIEKYAIQLLLNPEYEEWDGEIIRLTNDISKSIDSDERLKKIDLLVLISQFLFKLEWDGITLESRKGIVSQTKKEELRARNFENYKFYKNQYEKM